MKLINKPTASLVKPCDMKDGEIGIIRKWKEQLTNPCGSIVQRFQNLLIVIGEPTSYWPINDESTICDGSCLIEILPPGTTLKI